MGDGQPRPRHASIPLILRPEVTVAPPPPSAHDSAPPFSGTEVMDPDRSATRWRVWVLVVALAGAIGVGLYVASRDAGDVVRTRALPAGP